MDDRMPILTLTYALKPHNRYLQLLRMAVEYRTSRVTHKANSIKITL